MGAIHYEVNESSRGPSGINNLQNFNCNLRILMQGKTTASWWDGLSDITSLLLRHINYPRA